MGVGLPEVAQGTAGTGLAWMGPNSSFDPVQFAADSYNVQAKADAEKKKAEKDAWKLIDLKPEDQYNIDNIDDTVPEVQEIQSYFTEKVKNKGGWDFETEAEAKKRTSEFGLDQKRKNNQYVKGTEYNKLLDADKGKEFNDAKMRQNYSIYVAPEKFVGTPGFKPYEAEYTKLVEKYKKDPYYSKNPERAIAKARLDFRDKYEGDLLQTYLKPESLGTIIKNNEDALLNTITTDQEYGNVTIKEVSNDRNQRTVKFSDGRIKYIDGTDKTATNLYNGDVDVKRSVKAHYDDLPDQDKERYEGKEDPALEWWKDFVNSSAGDVTKSRNINTGGGNRISFSNGYSADSNYDISPYKLDTRTSRTKSVWDPTTTRGFSVKKGTTELALKDITPTHFYLSESSTQKPIPAGTRVNLDGASPFKAPTFSGNLTFSDLKQQLINKGKWEDFMKEFGEKYAGAPASGSLDGVILTNKEVKKLQEWGFQKYIKDRKFVRGGLSYYEQSGQKDKPATLKRFDGAIIPLEFANSSMEAETGVDFNQALDQWADEDYNIFTKSTEEVEQKADANGFVEE